MRRHTEKKGEEIAHILSERAVFDQVFMSEART
jgi:hypothetical protein